MIYEFVYVNLCVCTCAIRIDKWLSRVPIPAYCYCQIQTYAAQMFDIKVG